VVVLLLWLLPATAWADSATIVLKSGEVTEAEVVNLEFGKQVTVRDAQGVEVTIPWTQIEKLQMHGDAENEPKKPVPAAAPTPAAVAATAAPVASTPAPAPQPQVDSKELASMRLQILEQQIEEKKEELPSLAGPIVFMGVGFGLGTLLFWSAHVTTTAVSYSSTEDAKTVSAPIYSLAGICTALGVVGAIWLGPQVAARNKKRKAIEPLEAERNRLLLDVKPTARGAVGVVTMQF
jgi:hypothetical protein